MMTLEVFIDFDELGSYYSDMDEEESKKEAKHKDFV